MATKTKAPAGTWWIAGGALALLFGLIFLLVTLFVQMPEMAGFKASGRVTDATVLDKESVRNVEGPRRRSRSSDYYISVGFSSAAGVPFAEAKADPAEAQSTAKSIFEVLDEKRPEPVGNQNATAQIPVTGEEYENLNRGDRISITFLPDNPAEARTTRRVREDSPLPMLAISGLMALLGLLALLRGIAQRRRAGPAGA